MNLKQWFYNKKKLPAGGSVRMRQYRRINYDYATTLCWKMKLLSSDDNDLVYNKTGRSSKERQYK